MRHFVVLCNEKQTKDDDKKRGIFSDKYLFLVEEKDNENDVVINVKRYWRMSQRINSANDYNFDQNDPLFSHQTME
jgi:hypothetical protein